MIPPELVKLLAVAELVTIDARGAADLWAEDALAFVRWHAYREAFGLANHRPLPQIDTTTK